MPKRKKLLCPQPRRECISGSRGVGGFRNSIFLRRGDQERGVRQRRNKCPRGYPQVPFIHEKGEKG